MRRIVELAEACDLSTRELKEMLTLTCEEEQQ